MAIDQLHTWIHRVGEHAGEEVTLRGWVHKNRVMKKLVFCVVRDGTGLCQGVITKGEISEQGPIGTRCHEPR